MDIKRKKKEKRIQLLGGLIGICVAVVSLFYFFHVEKAEAHVSFLFLFLRMKSLPESLQSVILLIQTWMYMTT